MGKIRDWMHGSGRKTVIAVVTVIAAAIVIHYFVVERHGKWGLESAYSAGSQWKRYHQSHRKIIMSAAAV